MQSDARSPLVGGALSNIDVLAVLRQLGIEPNEELLRGMWHATGMLEKLIPTSTIHFRAAVFVATQVAENAPLRKDGRWLGRELARTGIDVITGGGPGGMEEVNAGAAEGRKDREKVRSIAVSLELPTENGANCYVSREYRHGIFLTRLHHFARLGRVFIVLDGGIGTLLEFLLIWQLLQKQHLVGTPLIVVGDMWLPFLDWVQRFIVDRGYAKQSDMDLVMPVPSVREALPIAVKAYGEFCSINGLAAA